MLNVIIYACIHKIAPASRVGLQLQKGEPGDLVDVALVPVQGEMITLCRRTRFAAWDGGRAQQDHHLDLIAVLGDCLVGGARRNRD